MACKAGAAVASLPLADGELLDRWLTDGTDSRGRRVSAVAMSHALLAAGQAVGPTTLKDHRGGRCACHRKAGP